MSREDRKKIIQDIERKRNSKVISLITNDRYGTHLAPDVISLINEHIMVLREEERKKIDLFLYSRGGVSDVPWTLVSMLREYCEEGSFSVLIPYRAHSAATVIALGADEIVMTKKAELGPIDITINGGPYNPTDDISHQRLPISVEDVTGYFNLLSKVGCDRPDEKMKGFELIATKLHPLALGSVNRLLEETKLVALRLLSTRAKPFPEEQNHEIIKRISSEIYSHGHTISRTEAKKYIGLNQVQNAENYLISNEMWALYEEYKSLFEFETPFKPEEQLVRENIDEKTWPNQSLACIESVGRFDICRRTIKVRKLRQVPPQLTLTLGNMPLPAINIPNLPAGMTQQQFAGMIQQIFDTVVQQSLNNALRTSIIEILKALPQSGFEAYISDSSWQQE